MRAMKSNYFRSKSFNVTCGMILVVASFSQMQNVRKHLSFVENSIIFRTIYREHALEKSAKSKLASCSQRKNYIIDALEEEMLSRNNDRELDQ